MAMAHIKQPSQSQYSSLNSTELTSMADYSGRDDGSLTPSHILKLSADQLFTALLLLPVDSVLAFSTTCRRFRSLIASSSTLWESICRREWGSDWADALKASLPHPRPLPWMSIFRQVSRLDSVHCHQVTEPDSDSLLPSSRASHSLNFVSDCLVLFGGGCEGGRHLDDTWAAYIGNNFNKALNWQKMHSGIPSGRFGHTCVVIHNNLVLFGGIDDRGVRHNDTWVGQVSCHENLGVNMSWRLLDVGPIQPPPRGAHATCGVSNRKMIVHGGIGLNGVRLNDTWVLELAESICFGSWRKLLIYPSPPPRSGHTLTCIGGARTVLFGGRGLGYEVLNDVWLLDISEEHSRWVQINYDLNNIPEGFLLPRVGHSALLILGGLLLIYGGEDSFRRRKDDFWMLDISATPTSRMQQQDRSNPKGVWATMWRRLRADGYKPNRRSFHRACVDKSGRYMYVFGGMVDGLLQPGESSGLRFDRELFLVELVLQL